MPVRARVLALCVVSLAMIARGEPSLAQPSPVQPVQPPPSTHPVNPIAPPTTQSVLASLSTAYTWDPIAERIAYVVRDASGESRSVAWLRLDRGDAQAGRPARFRVDLGRLSAYGEGDRLVAVHALNNQDAAVLHLPGGVTPRALHGALPRLVMPQATWCFGERRENLATEGELFGIGAVRWREHAQKTDDGPRIEGAIGDLSGEAQGGSIALLVDEATGVLKRLTLTLGSVELLADVERLPTEDPARWEIPHAARTVLGTLTALKALPAEVAIGDRLPTIGFLTDAMEGWSLVDQLKAIAALPPQPASRVAGALILVQPTDEGTLRNLRAAALATDSLSREFDIQRRQGSLASPRMTGAVIALVELGDVTPKRLHDLRARVDKPLQGVQTLPRLWSAGSFDALKRLAPGCRSAVVLVDGDQRVLGVIPLDGERVVDAPSLIDELRQIISAPFPEPAPIPTPAPTASPASEQTPPR
jgi:hypothetical protein